MISDIFIIFLHILIQVIFIRRIKVFLLHGILLTISALVMRTIGMFFNIYISNKIGTEAIGIYQLIMSVYMFAITIANSGIHLATTRIVSEQEAFGMEAGIKRAMRKCVKYSLFMGFLACVLLFIFSSSIANYYLHSKISPIPLRILAISLPFLSLSSCMNGYFAALRKVKKTISAQVLEQFLKITLISFLLNYFLPSGLEYACISLVLGSTISEFISCLFLGFLFIMDKRKLSSNSYKDTNYTKQILKIALPISFTSYIRSGLSTIKQWLIPIGLEKSGLSCENAISSYGIINGMVMPLIMFPCTFISSFSSLLIPEFSYLNAKREIEKINFSLNKILKFCFIFSFLIMGIFWCFSEEINKMVYPNVDVSLYIKLLCPLIVLMYIDNIVDSILKGLDKQVSVMGINIIDLISSISLIYFLLPFQGIKGYIIVLFTSEIINGILSLILLIKNTNLKIDFSNWILKPLLSIFFISFIIKTSYSYNIFELIMHIFIFCISYFVILFLMKGLIKKDFKV